MTMRDLADAVLALQGTGRAEERSLESAKGVDFLLNGKGAGPP